MEGSRLGGRAMRNWSDGPNVSDMHANQFYETFIKYKFNCLNF